MFIMTSIKLVEYPTKILVELGTVLTDGFGLLPRLINLNERRFLYVISRMTLCN